jgi:hypothetical protein
MLASCGAVIGLSGVLLLAPSIGQEVFNIIAFQTLSHPQNFSPQAIHYLKFSHGILAATMIGWMAQSILTIQGPFRRMEKEGWRSLAVSTSAWFFPDSILSIAMGYHYNVLFNLVCYLGFGIPLLATYRDFFPKN